MSGQIISDKELKSLKKEYGTKLLFKLNVCDEDYVIRAANNADIEEWKKSDINIETEDITEQLRDFLVEKCMVWPNSDSAEALLEEKPAGVVYSIWQTLVDVSGLHFLYQAQVPGDIVPLFDHEEQEEEPDADAIEEIKKTNKNVYKIDVLWYSFIVRPMTVGDYKEFRKSDDEDESMNNLLNRVVLWAPSFIKSDNGELELDKDDVPAGVSDALFSKCLEISGFQQAEVTKL